VGTQSLESGALAASAVLSAVSGLPNIEGRPMEHTHSLWSADDIIANVRNRCNHSVHQGFGEGRLTALPGHSAFAPGAALAAPYLPFAILVGIDPAGGKLSFYDQGTQSPWVLIGATLPPSHLTPLYNRNRFVADPQP
jgi:hypothetical protein